MVNIRLTRTVEDIHGKKYQLTTTWSVPPNSIRGQSAPIITTIYSDGTLISITRTSFKNNVTSADLQY